MKLIRDLLNTNQRYGWRVKSIVVILALSLVPIFLASKVAFTTLAQRQDNRNKEIKKINFQNEPIQILEMSSNNTSIRFEEVFVDDDWLKDFSVKFKNVSNRTITFIYLSLDFPETKSSGRLLLVHSIRYGVAGAAKDFRAEDLRALPPDGVDIITLSAKSYETLTRFVSERVALSDLTRANVSIERVEFADGTYWGAGDLFQPDPARPGKFIVVEGQE